MRYPEQSRNRVEGDHRRTEHTTRNRSCEGWPELPATKDQRQESGDDGKGRRKDVPCRIDDDIGSDFSITCECAGLCLENR